MFNEVMLSVENIHVDVQARKSRTSFPVLRGVSFSLAQQEAIAIIGQSGHGKTTLLRVLEGSTSPIPGSYISGKVEFNDKSLFGIYEKKVCFVFKRASLYADPAVKADIEKHVSMTDEAFAGGNKKDAPLAQSAVERNKISGLSTIFVTHNLPAVAEAVDRVLHLHDGQIVWSGHIDEMREQVGSLPEPTETYLKYVNRIFEWQP